MPDTGYTYALMDTLNNKVSIQRIQFEIQNDSLINQLSTYVNADNLNFTIYFKTPLTTSEKSALDILVAAHDGQEFLVNKAQLVRVNEEDDDPLKRTGGHFRSKMYEFNIPLGNGPHFFEWTFPHPIGILSMFFLGDSLIFGDKFDVKIARNTIIGNITSNVNIGDDVINVSETVTANAYIGMEFILDDGTNEESLGYIVEVNPAEGTIKTENSATIAFSATSPTFTKITIVVIENFYIHESSVPVVIGSTKIGASFVAANTTISFIYTNTSGLPGKTFRGVLEFLY